MIPCLVEVTEKLADNLYTTSSELKRFGGLLERMEFFKSCPEQERVKLKKLIQEIDISSRALKSNIAIMQGG